MNFEAAPAGLPLYYDEESRVGSIVVPLGANVLLRLDTRQGTVDPSGGWQGTTIRAKLYVPAGSSVRFIEPAFVARDGETSEQRSPIEGLHRTIRLSALTPGVSSLRVPASPQDLLVGWTAADAQSSGVVPVGNTVLDTTYDVRARNVFEYEVRWEGFLAERFTVTIPAVEVDGQVIQGRTISFSYVERTFYCSAALFTAQSCG